LIAYQKKQILIPSKLLITSNYFLINKELLKSIEKPINKKRLNDNESIKDEEDNENEENIILTQDIDKSKYIWSIKQPGDELQRTVICGDAITWLKEQTILPGSVITSLPDFSYTRY